MRPPSLWLVLLFLSACLSIGSPARAADGCPSWDHDCRSKANVSGDQGKKAVVASGVSIPSVDPASDLGKRTTQAADCSDCEWSSVPACIASQPGVVEIGCLGAGIACTRPGDIQFKVFMRRGAGPWVLQGTVCLGPGERPASVPDVGEAVRVEVVKYLPDARPSFQPANGGLVNLATVFAAGEPASIRTESFDVLGFTVVVTAQARWEWTFDEGVVAGVDSPGGAYPDMSVAHTYTEPGTRRVSVTTFWRAQFTLDGAGPFAVPGPEISKTAGPFDVPVREARAELVASETG